MADVGDVHDMLDAVAQQFECSTQDVCIQEGAEVPDVRVVVDGGAAGVEGQRKSRPYNALLARKRVVKPSIPHVWIIETP